MQIQTKPVIGWIEREASLAVVVITTAISLAVSLISLSSGFFIIFQNLFYIPIIFACIFYLRRGLIFSILLALFYLALLLSFAGFDHLINGAIRVIIFITVACVITYLAEKWVDSERTLEKKHGELRTQLDEIARIRDELAESNEYLGNLISHANAPIIVWDRALRITQFNGAFGKLTGIAPEQAIGSHLEILVPEEQRDESMDLIRRAMDGEMWDVVEIPILHRTGDVRTVLWNSANIHGSDGETIIATIAQGQDITDRKKAVKAICQKNQELEAAEQALHTANKKLQLLSSITRHDIMNKTMALQGYLDLAMRQIDDPKLSGYLTEADKAATAIQRKIEYTKVYENLGVKKPVWQPLSAIVAMIGYEKRLPIQHDCGDFVVYADPMFERVLQNLYDNNIRHAEEADCVQVRCEERDRDLIIIWEDNGPGIPDDQKEQIFEKGFGKNTGFGLFLSREILAITGIAITETGVYGEGTRFEICVPSGAWQRTGEEIS